MFSVFIAIPSDITIKDVGSIVEADESDSEFESDTEEEDSDMTLSLDIPSSFFFFQIPVFTCLTKSLLK